MVPDLIEEVVSQEFAVEASSPLEEHYVQKRSMAKGGAVRKCPEDVSMKIVGDAVRIAY